MRVGAKERGQGKGGKGKGLGCLLPLVIDSVFLPLAVGGLASCPGLKWHRLGAIEGELNGHKRRF